MTLLCNLTQGLTLMFKLRVAVVVPRYGKSLGGGAETLLKSLVDSVFKDNFSEVEVWTTCAIDHRTWDNFHPPGTEIIDDVKVTRFTVDKRNLDVFITCEHAMQTGRVLSLDEQFRWLKSGVNSHALYEHIAKNSKDFDIILFGPYLFPITYWGALICPEKSILVPCLHDEHYAYLECFRELFRKVRGVFFNALPEQDLAFRIYQLSDLDKKAFEVGMGFNHKDCIAEYQNQKFILYSGRKEQGKGLDFLLSCYEQLPEELRRNELKLYLIGSGSIDFREELPIGVIDLGFVSEDQKLSYMKLALALVQPSINESFSIVMMESWLQGTPVIVRSDCAVTKYHVSSSGGGLWFNDAESFKNTVTTLLNDNQLRDNLGKFGQKFVNDKYSWPAVTRRIEDSLRHLGF